VSLVNDVQSYLADVSLVDGSTGWPSVRRRVNDQMGDALVVITEDGGLEPETPSETGIGSATFREPAVQVRVRAGAWDGDAAYAQSQAIFDVLHGARNVTMGSTFYHRVKAQTASPVFIGYDEQGRPEFTTSFRAVLGQ
jgi:hypothetical protein